MMLSMRVDSQYGESETVYAGGVPPQRKSEKDEKPVRSDDGASESVFLVEHRGWLGGHWAW